MRIMGIRTISLLGLALLLGPSAAVAVPTPEQACQKGRYVAAGKYANCHQKRVGKLHGGDGLVQERFSGCRDKYRRAWTKLQENATGTGSTCDASRFSDNGNGTVTDRLTTLQWEKKTDDASIHDKDNTYTWNTVGGGTAANGSAYTTFLGTLNTGCFAGHCDWRLPTVAELQTILLEPYPCTTSACIDPVFGPTVATNHWSSTTVADTAAQAWCVSFDDASTYVECSKETSRPVRAVRGGL